MSFQIPYPRRTCGINLPGPGDSDTWGACTGHPNDPRTPELGADADAILVEIDEIRGHLAHAETCAERGDLIGARAALQRIQENLQ